MLRSNSVEIRLPTLGSARNVHQVGKANHRKDMKPTTSHIKKCMKERTLRLRQKIVLSQVGKKTGRFS